MRILTISPILIALGLCSACASNPVHSTEQVASRGSVAFIDAPAMSSVFINDIFVGHTETYNGVEGVLQIPQGRHQVRVVDAHGNTLYDQPIYVGDGLIRLDIM